MIFFTQRHLKSTFEKMSEKIMPFFRHCDALNFKVRSKFEDLSKQIMIIIVGSLIVFFVVSVEISKYLYFTWLSNSFLP